MREAPKPVPEGFQTITPYLVVRNAPEAIAFYKRAFGATERLRLTDRGRGRVRHAELQIGDSRLFVTDVPLAPETRVPDTDDNTPVWLYVYVADPDALFDRAIRAGADVVTPMGDQPWGDRYGCLCDPCGYRWGIASRRETLTKDELEERMQHAYAED
jgi:PhnB protein